MPHELPIELKALNCPEMFPHWKDEMFLRSRGYRSTGTFPAPIAPSLPRSVEVVHLPGSLSSTVTFEDFQKWGKGGVVIFNDSPATPLLCMRIDLAAPHRPAKMRKTRRNLEDGVPPAFVSTLVQGTAGLLVEPEPASHTWIPSSTKYEDLKSDFAAASPSSTLYVSCRPFDVAPAMAASSHPDDASHIAAPHQQAQIPIISNDMDYLCFSTSSSMPQNTLPSMLALTWPPPLPQWPLMHPYTYSQPFGLAGISETQTILDSLSGASGTSTLSQMGPQQLSYQLGDLDWQYGTLPVPDLTTYAAGTSRQDPYPGLVTRRSGPVRNVASGSHRVHPYACPGRTPENAPGESSGSEPMQAMMASYISAPQVYANDVSISYMHEDMRNIV
ncbi:hypothetical protein L226DRAFT_524191 [Lentinus tigrinus ALCF2SS1-7]|uniref:uncharacterized protein n=1 Tax=Lentinus tigrinus ALCF2SS1-7 TaxID=1328758 RepID=UPI001165CBB3|nr:hypothetical protein L226DRAFT_524191 [Lentinus tigrinus ALCF2SS1-7]